jgi:predicted DNA-binding transcriptional regulator YafY
MRADRLVAILLMLQARGRVTAAEVAAELEISERTARRDLEALGMAGLPIYSQQGRNGGWQLMGGARTDLSGLTSTEARALFLVAGPASSATPEVKAALRKLLRALPEPFRADAEAASAAVHVDPAGWGGRAGDRPPPPFLEVLQHAVIEGRQVELGYVARDLAESTRVVHPLGLASKGHAWYLVADTDKGLRTFRVDRVRSVEPTGEPVVRPPDFDLAEAWKMVTDRMEEQRFGVWATGTADPSVIGPLRWLFGPRVHIGPPGPDGRIAVELGGHDAVALSWRLAGFGSDVVVTDPPELREELRRIGEQLAATYATP